VRPVVTAIIIVETMDIIMRGIHLPCNIEKQVIKPTPAGTKKKERCFSRKLLTSSTIDSFRIPVKRRKTGATYLLRLPAWEDQVPCEGNFQGNRQQE
jgi:hypothetical protein